MTTYGLRACSSQSRFSKCSVMVFITEEVVENGRRFPLVSLAIIFSRCNHNGAYGSGTPLSPLRGSRSGQSPASFGKFESRSYLNSRLSVHPLTILGHWYAGPFKKDRTRIGPELSIERRPLQAASEPDPVSHISYGDCPNRTPTHFRDSACSACPLYRR